MIFFHPSKFRQLLKQQNFGKTKKIGKKVPQIKRPVAHEKYAFTHSFYWLSAKFLTCPSGIWHKIDNLPRAKLEHACKNGKKVGFISPDGSILKQAQIIIWLICEKFCNGAIFQTICTRNVHFSLINSKIYMLILTFMGTVT